jgi:hypothetical protein
MICFIADIDGIKDGDEQLLKREIDFFRQFNYFIVHNASMKSWLKQYTPGATITAIEFFDFLAQPLSALRSLSNDIAFAGNLQKSPFLKDLYLVQKRNPTLHFHLYGGGGGEEAARQPNATWHGIEEPYKLPAKIKGSFGLLWDGTSIERPAGSHGVYMQYISHHKLSLYILCKLPIIAPVRSAGAELIKNYGIGITVNDLYEIEDKIKSIGADDYSRMQGNMQPLAEKISKGKCLADAIDNLLQQVS